MSNDLIARGAVCAAVDKLFAVNAQEVSLVLGLKNELSRLIGSLIEIMEFLEDAERRQATEPSVRTWLHDLSGAAYDADDVVDEISYENLRQMVEGPKQTKSKTWFCFDAKTDEQVPRKLAAEVNKIMGRLQSIASAGSINHQFERRDSIWPPSLPPAPVMETGGISPDSVVGRERDVEKLVNMLTNPPPDDTISVIPIVGMGGSGKTTLARLIFNNPGIKGYFNERIWVVVSDNFDPTNVFKNMLKSLKETFPEDGGREAVVRKLRDILAGKRYLLVLDDLCNEDAKAWDDFKNSLVGINRSKGNAILVTTRFGVVCNVVNQYITPHLSQVLSDDECWSLIKEMACGDKQVPYHQEGILKEIARRCRGLPLAAKLIGRCLEGVGDEVDAWFSIFRTFASFWGDADYILQVMKVCYDLLPVQSLKICFSYCSVFPKDSILDREELVQQWMAQGFLPDLQGRDMESTGNLYFDILLHRCFFQEALVDKLGNIVSCKMHNLVHDLACWLSKSETFHIGHFIAPSEIPNTTRYLSVESLGEMEGITKEKASNVRLLLSVASITENKLPDFNRLHSLTLREAYIKEFPTSVDKLIHLRYLDASYNPIERLPDSICKLYHLETLRIFTLNLQNLPEKLHNLIRLRHLYFNGPQIEMPPHTGRLTCLQTLSSFNVSDKEGCRIDELGYLKNLGGQLTIRNLELVKDKEEATKADLIAKTKIYKLKFIWSKSRDANNNYQNVLEGLQPHKNLKSIKIEGFRGQNFPSWAMKMGIDALIQLKISHCDFCENVPTLGHLQCLKYLEFDGLTRLRSIDTSFYGDDDGPFFPSLERLVLKRMFNLVDWKKPAFMPEKECGVQVFPRLEYLELNGCPKLMDVPSHFPCITNLHIRSVKTESILEKICSENLTSLTKLQISCTNELTSLPDKLFYNNHELQELLIYSCVKLKELPKGLHCLRSIEKLEIGDCPSLQSISYPGDEKGLTALRHLKISYCQELSSLPSGMLKSCTSLESLVICGLANLTSLPVEKWEMDDLRSLKIFKCPKLMRFPANIRNLSRLTELSIGQFSESIDIRSFPNMRHLNSLRTLTFYGWRTRDFLPRGLMDLTSLRNLILYELRITALPEWLDNLSSLQELELRRCEKLQHMPPEEAMRRLTTLKKLYIQDCPELEERCQPAHPDSQSNKISHIPVVKIGTRSIRFHPLFLDRNH